MNKILTVEQAIVKSGEVRANGSKVVVSGGCFDLIHVGHVTFLERAKEQGDVLFVLLEADVTIQKSKGVGRPVNLQEDRALVLAALMVVDFVVLLPSLMPNSGYDEVLFGLKPAIIATTAGDVYRAHKERQAAAIGGQVIDVTLPIQDQSTSRILRILEEI